MTYPSATAEKVLNEVKIRSSDDLRYLEEIAWERKALVRVKLISGAEARLTTYGDRAVITISSAISNAHRKRFSIAHELGHLEMHRYRSMLSACLSEDIRDDDVKEAGRQLEREANRFASALLLPERFFKPLCDEGDPSLDHIAELAHKFDTSLTATALRYVRFTEAPVALVYGEDQDIKWVAQSAELKKLQLFIHARRKLDSTSLAVRQSQRRQHVPIDIWFDEGKFDKNAQIMEHSWPMPRHNAVLTLLWQDEDITGEDDDWMW